MLTSAEKLTSSTDSGNSTTLAPVSVRPATRPCSSSAQRPDGSPTTRQVTGRRVEPADAGGAVAGRAAVCDGAAVGGWAAATGGPPAAAAPLDAGGAAPVAGATDTDGPADADVPGAEPPEALEAGAEADDPAGADDAVGCPDDPDGVAATADTSGVGTNTEIDGPELPEVALAAGVEA